jgi:hypothetical protein
MVSVVSLAEIKKNKGLESKYFGEEELLIALENFIDLYKERKKENEDIVLPINIFSDSNIGGLETITKYLRENLSLKFSQIARLLNRNERTIWVAYRNASKKKGCVLEFKEIKYYVPVHIFSNRKRGPLEALVVYLRDDLNLSFKQIASLLDREYSVIWLSYRNGVKKS